MIKSWQIKWTVWNNDDEFQGTGLRIDEVIVVQKKIL